MPTFSICFLFFLIFSDFLQNRSDRGGRGGGDQKSSFAILPEGRGGPKIFVCDKTGLLFNILFPDFHTFELIFIKRWHIWQPPSPHLQSVPPRLQSGRLLVSLNLWRVSVRTVRTSSNWRNLNISFLFRFYMDFCVKCLGPLHIFLCIIGRDLFSQSGPG